VDAVKSNQHVGLSLRTLFKIVKIGCISRKCCTPVHSSAANWVENQRFAAALLHGRGLAYPRRRGSI